MIRLHMIIQFCPYIWGIFFSFLFPLSEYYTLTHLKMLNRNKEIK